MAHENEYSQLLVESIRWKDTHGTNKQIRHDLLFDAVHWNTHYPSLPRIISHDPSMLPHISIGGTTISPRIEWQIDALNTTKPYYIGETQTSAVHAYLDYSNKVFKKRKERFPFVVELLKGAFRPHPEIQSLINKFLLSIDTSSYMVLHARIEADMQKHSRCLELKVTALKDIIRMLEIQFAEPPVSTLIVILDRESLEKEVANPENENMLAVENLKVLNDFVQNGAWRGKVKPVFPFLFPRSTIYSFVLICAWTIAFAASLFSLYQASTSAIFDIFND